VHYYFPARDDLIAALVVEAFDELAEVTTAAVDGRHVGPSTWVEAALAYRAWALDNPERFSLAHSATAARLKDRTGVLDAKDRAVRALIGPLDAGIAARKVSPPVAPGRITARLRSQIQAWSAAAGVQGSQHLLLYLLQAYTVVQGAVLLTITASLPRELLVGDELFRAQLDLVLEGR
jgi:AcrR family transcriptional regulator